MKKIVFLLIMAVLLAGVMPAMDAARPPGDIFTVAAMSEFGADIPAVTSDSVRDEPRFQFDPRRKQADINYKPSGFFLIKPAN